MKHLEEIELLDKISNILNDIRTVNSYLRNFNLAKSQRNFSMNIGFLNESHHFNSNFMEYDSYRKFIDSQLEILQYRKIQFLKYLNSLTKELLTKNIDE